MTDWVGAEDIVVADIVADVSLELTSNLTMIWPP